MELFSLLGKIAIDTSGVGDKIDGVGNKVKGLGDKLGQAGETVAGWGKKLSETVTLAGIAIGGVAVNSALKFEDSMASINTLLDDDSHLAGYEGAIKNFSSETGLSLDTVASGMYQTISSIGDGGEATEKMFNIMGKSAKAGGAEVSDSVALISAGMKGYNQVNEETAQKISDLGFQTSKLGVTTFPELAKSMQPLFPLSSAIGLSYEELFGVMATGTGVTGNTAEVTTQFKAVLSNLMQPTENMSKLIDKYGYSNAQAMLQTEGLSGFLKICQTETGGQADKMAELFSSTEALTLMTALSGTQFDTFKDKLGQMQTATGATEAAYDKMATKGDKLRITFNQAKNTLMDLGATILTTLAPTIETVCTKISEACTWFTNLDAGTKNTIVKIGGLVIALGPALIVAGKVITVIGSVIKVGGLLLGGIGKIAGFVTGTLIPVIGAIGAPVGIVIGIITALIAIGVALYKNWDEIKEFAGKIWEGIKNVVSGVVDAIGGFITGLKDAVSEKWNQLTEKTKETWNTVKEFASTKASEMKDKVLNHFVNMKEKQDEIFSNIKEAAVTKFTEMKDKLVEHATDLKEKQIEAFSIMKDKIIEHTTKLKDTQDAIYSKVKEIAITKFREMKDQVVEHVSSLKEKAVSKFTEMKTNTLKQAGEIYSGAVDKFTNLKEKGVAAFNNLKDGIGTTIGNVYNIIKDGFDKAVNYIKDLAANAFSWGSDIVDGIANGIRGAIGKVTDAVKSVADKIKSFLHFSVPDEGPLTEYESWMPDFMQGLASGIKQNKSLVTDAIKGLAGEMALPDFDYNMTAKQAFVGRSVADSSQSVDDSSRVEKAIDIFKEAVENLTNGLNGAKIVLSTGETVGALSVPMNEALGKLAQKRGRGK